MIITEATPALKAQFAQFVEGVNISFFNRALRYVILEFLKTDAGRDDDQSARFLENMQILYVLLDAIEDAHIRQRPPTLTRNPPRMGRTFLKRFRAETERIGEETRKKYQRGRTKKKKR